ncbi:acetyl-CoA carboxylase biotin carboxyl carrier protein [candidate division KSB1 bacterium]|nr:MAG: acetyl-CoA carboxylase biotin carboxyl carrier protein [candidate division KSB1 bacterium]
MDLKIIKELVKLVEKSSINELDIQEKDLQIKITKNPEQQIALGQIQHIPASVQQPVAVAPQSQGSYEPAKTSSASESKNDNLVEIPSPMVGTFYRAPSPGSPPFVNEGDVIQPGKVLCIIEAMKLMNEIESEVSGKIVKILVENGEPVEFNQPLFLVEKN